MIRLPPRSQRTDTLFPYTTLFRAPGLVVTENTREGQAHNFALYEAHHLTPRLGEPDDLAAMVALLASDDGKFITGQVIRVDGGISTHFPHVAETRDGVDAPKRSEEHTSELQSLMRTSYAVFCL